MSPASARTCFDLTAHNVRRTAAIIVDGHVISTLVIRTPIAGGEVLNLGDFSAEEARAMASRLAAGTSKLAIELNSDDASGK
jgi:preprotein translocase subunit SecD